MNLDELKQFIKQVGWGMLATTNGRIVGVRPMAGLVWNGNELWCATFSASDKVAQLQKVPYAEYCFCDSTGRHVRIAGPCSISADNTEKLWLFDAVPTLKDYISDPSSPDYVIIKMSPENVRAMETTDLTYKEIELPKK